MCVLCVVRSKTPADEDGSDDQFANVVVIEENGTPTHTLVSIAPRAFATVEPVAVDTVSSCDARDVFLSVCVVVTLTHRSLHATALALVLPESSRTRERERVIQNQEKVLSLIERMLLHTTEADLLAACRTLVPLARCLSPVPFVLLRVRNADTHTQTYTRTCL